jgi:hypothetical protein
MNNEIKSVIDISFALLGSICVAAIFAFGVIVVVHALRLAYFALDRITDKIICKNINDMDIELKENEGIKSRGKR